VSITQTAAGAAFFAPASVNIAANASDDGTATKVEFFNGATKLGDDTTAPYAYAWTGVAQGTYTVTAWATDNAGKTATRPGHRDRQATEHGAHGEHHVTCQRRRLRRKRIRHAVQPRAAHLAHAVHTGRRRLTAP
jgi:hypothetical protein